MMMKLKRQGSRLGRQHGPWELECFSFPGARDQGRLDTTHLVHNSYLEEKRAKVDEELGAWLEYGQIREVRSHT
jgi:hypothetical protein